MSPLIIPNTSASFHGVNPTFQGVTIQTANADGSSDTDNGPGANLTLASSLADIGKAHTASDAAHKLQLESEAMEHEARRAHVMELNRQREINIAAQHATERKLRKSNDDIAAQLAHETSQ